MRLRILLSAVLVTALALPVIATATRFPDVPADHQYADAIRWASDPEEFNGNPLFRGFPDGNFGPDEELTESQFAKVVDRLFDTADRWTRAETAALLYHGFQGLRTTTTTQPVITETTTTTIQPQNHNPQLQVAIHTDRDDGLDRFIYIHWIRPGWESQKWKWRLHTNCKSNRDNRWQTTDNGWSNVWYDARRRCLTDNWQIEIEWENGKRFVSEPCVRRGDSWDCNTPSDWSSWADYSHIPPVVTYKNIEYHNGNGEYTTYILTLTSNRQFSDTMSFCGRKIGVRLEEGDNQFIVTCRSEQKNSQLYVWRTWEGIIRDISEDILEDILVSFPTDTGTAPQLNPQQLNPKIVVVTGTHPDHPDHPDDYEREWVRVDVLLGNSELARRTIVASTMENDGNLARKDPGGNLLSSVRGVFGLNVLFDGYTYTLEGYYNLGGNRRVYDSSRTGWNDMANNGAIMRIEVHEPGAATHYISLVLDEIL